MPPTNVRDPKYFHKVVDCQWACPAHTNVPEYIRLIAQGRFTDAYLLNRASNVFPGILGRTCDRPCEPACRRGRLEGEQPVAICRLKRVAADHCDEEKVRESLPRSPLHKNGKRIACIGAGPASLTVANDLLPLGYEVTIFEKLPVPGGLMRSNIPAFRLPEKVLNDEIEMIVGMGATMRYDHPIDSMKRLLEDGGFDAVFVGTGAPRGKNLEIPGRYDSDKIFIGIDWLHGVAFEHITSIEERVLIIGVGNTAMDCCRTSRRLGGTDIKVMARRPRPYFKASPWELDDAEEEQVQIIVNHAPKEFVIEDGKLKGMMFERLTWEPDEKGQLTKSRVVDTVFIPADAVILAIGQEGAFPWIERDIGIEMDKWGMVKVDKATFQCTRPGVFFGGDAAWGPENIIWAVEHGHQAAISIDNHCHEVPLDRRPAQGMNLTSTKMGLHEWSYSNDYNPAHRQKMKHVDLVERFKSVAIEVETGFTAEQTAREVERCLNCDVQTVFTDRLCIECDACVDVCPLQCLTITREGDEQDLRGRLSAPALNEKQDIFTSDPLPQTQRVMVKDEDVCVHCGLCAERCPTAAWDMQRFDLTLHYAGGQSGGAPTPETPADSQRATPSDHVTPRINDFALKLANVNGTGSASANGLLMQAIFRMGIPVSGKNLFPSNIQGLPTWYEIRVNKEGHTARTAEYELMVAMNAETFARDVREVKSGGYLLYDSTWPLHPSLRREDVTVLGVPYAELCNGAFSQSRERTLMKNICYVGTLAALLHIDMEIISGMLKEKFGKKPALMESNHKAIMLGYDYARAHLDCPLPLQLEKMDATRDSILIDGNTATALGCVYAGATVAAWYPITPSTSVLDAFKSLCEKFRYDKQSGDRRYAILQAEDELSAIGMVIGAGWNGARAFTSTSGPGISLMNELIGLAYYAEIPAVIVDVQRVGPATGMPTRTQQGDILLAAYASHGDTKHIVLFPANPEECFYFAAQCFDLAERFQTPVFMLTDLDIGMNDWVIPRLKWDDGYRPDRGKVLSAAEIEALPKYYRYSPEDELGVAARTLPGVSPKGAFFTRGSGHNKLGGYTEIPDEYQEVMERLLRKHTAARAHVPSAIVEICPGARFGVLTVGGCDLAVREALASLAREGTVASYCRVRGFPFGDDVEAFLSAHDTVFVVEQNRDAQLRSLLVLETQAPKEKLRSILAYGGFPLQASQVVAGIKACSAARRGGEPTTAQAETRIEGGVQ